MRHLTVDLLNHLFEYDKETGNLIWKTRPTNSVKAGEIAGSETEKGYIRIAINHKKYRAHRLVFLMHKGYLPKTLDHINGDRKDNRIENLRPATLAQNAQNRDISSRNKSGYKGVCWDKQTKKWKAEIETSGERVRLGYYNTPEEADKVVRKAREELHGDFAHHGDDND